MGRKILLSILAAVFTSLTATTPLFASTGLFASSVSRAASTARSLERSGSWSSSSEESLVDELDRLADEFHGLAADGASIHSAANELLDTVERTHARYVKGLDAIQAEIIRQDGDLEAAQDSAAWRDRELFAMRLRYRLNWIQYEVAMRYERSTETRKRLLENARSGFREFIGIGDAELESESLFGRGLVSKALKKYDDAINDFHDAQKSGATPERIREIRVPLAEAYLSSKRYSDALGATREILAESRAGEAGAQAEFLRAKTLLLALRAGKTGGRPAAGLRKEAARTLEALYKRGGYWKEKSVQLVDSGIDDPAAWKAASSSSFITWLVADSLKRRGDCDSSVPLYQQLIDRKAYQDEAYYGKASCQFHLGRYDSALPAFDAYVERQKGDSPRAREARYLAFKSAEAVALSTPADSPEAEEAKRIYRNRTQAFVEHGDKHDKSFEGWFRLGEILREEEAFTDCADAFSKVRATSSFGIKASFLSAQCAFESILKLPESEDPLPQDVENAIASLESFSTFAEQKIEKEKGASAKALINPLRAKAVVMTAALQNRSGVGSMERRIELLNGFEERFPEQSDLLPEVRSLRVVAFQQTGDLKAAGSELELLLADDSGAGYRHESLKKLGIIFLKDASRRQETNPEEAQHSRKVALRIYERLIKDAEKGAITLNEQQLASMKDLVTELQGGLTAPAEN